MNRSCEKRNEWKIFTCHEFECKNIVIWFIDRANERNNDDICLFNINYLHESCLEINLMRNNISPRLVTKKAFNENHLILIFETWFFIVFFMIFFMISSRMCFWRFEEIFFVLPKHELIAFNDIIVHDMNIYRENIWNNFYKLKSTFHIFEQLFCK